MEECAIKGNTIPKARRYMMFNLSMFDCLTEEERNLYNEYKINNKIDVREEIKKKILMSVKSLEKLIEKHSSTKMVNL